MRWETVRSHASPVHCIVMVAMPTYCSWVDLPVLCIYNSSFVIQYIVTWTNEELILMLSHLWNIFFKFTSFQLMQVFFFIMSKKISFFRREFFNESTIWPIACKTLGFPFHLNHIKNNKAIFLFVPLALWLKLFFHS